MARRNHTLPYRPLRGGIAIWNPNAGGAGTIGLFGTASDNTVWLISCYHVIGRPGGGAFPNGEPIYQVENHPAFVVAVSSRTRADAELDCAAAQLTPGTMAVNELLGIGPLDAPTLPEEGMIVCKAGQETEITEGVIDRVDGHDVVVIPPHHYPGRYDLTGKGDSGSIWIERDTKRPVALHRVGNDTGPEVAYATSIIEVLQALRLTPLA